MVVRCLVIRRCQVLYTGTNPVLPPATFTPVWYGQCQNYSYRDTTPVVWADGGIDITDGSCYTVMPGINFTIPALADCGRITRYQYQSFKFVLRW
jgi:hypothetical protein